MAKQPVYGHVDNAESYQHEADDLHIRDLALVFPDKISPGDISFEPVVFHFIEFYRDNSFFNIIIAAQLLPNRN